MIKQIKFDGVKIRESFCSAIKTNIRLKEFNNYVVCNMHSFYNNERKKSKDGQGEYKENGTSLTEGEIIRWLNKAESFEYREGVLTIETKKYIFSVFVKEDSK